MISEREKTKRLSNYLCASERVTILNTVKLLLGLEIL